MPKLSDMIKKALKEDVTAAIAAPVDTKAPKQEFRGSAAVNVSADADRVADIAFITKSLRGGSLIDAEKRDLAAKFKAVGVTTDITSLLPDGFSGTFMRDVEKELNVAKLFPMGMVAGGAAHDIIAVGGIQAYITNEATDGTDSSESYITFVKTTKKIMAVVRKSYEAMADSLIDIAAEIRYELVRAIAEGIEEAVVNGDLSATHMDADVAANSPKKVCNGLRKHAKEKGTVDFTGVALTEDQMFAKLMEMQLAGGKYLSDTEVSKGNVILIVDNYMFTKFRLYDSFRTIEKAGTMATLFGGKVDSVFSIPVISSDTMPKVSATGVVSSTPADNLFSSCIMANIKMFKLFSNGSVISQSDTNIINQSLIYTTSVRFGFCGIYDSTEAAVNTVVAAYKTAILGINIAR